MKYFVLTTLAFLHLAAAPASAATINGITRYIPPGSSTPTPIQTEVTLEGPVQRTQTTTSNGAFHFVSLPAGTYTLVAVPVTPPPGTTNLSGDCDVPVNLTDIVSCDILLTSQ